MTKKPKLVLKRIKYLKYKEIGLCYKKAKKWLLFGIFSIDRL